MNILVTGEIRVAKSLDRETLSRHVLKVTAYERLNPSIAASTTVVVDLLDVQDNSPVFERNSYFAEIREDAPIGTTVLSVFARDFDDGLNGEVEYKLEYGEKADEPIKQLFSINSDSGVIQTAMELDREEPVSLNSTALVEININDVNDNTPKFMLADGTKQDICETAVAENATVPLLIFQLQAKDPDAGPNGKVHYSIVTTSSPIFSIDYESGELSLREAPDPRQSPLTLLVRAKDGGQPALSSTLQCTIHIQDVNDHSPTFLHAEGAGLREIVVEENVAIGHELGRVFAVDEDSGVNGEIHYKLIDSNELKQMPQQNLSQLFELDETTGVLRTKSELDRELQDSYLFQIVAEDRGQPPLSSSLGVLLTVKDVNDNAPQFEQPIYHLELAEDTPRGKQLLNLKAVDNDLDQKLTYRIEHMDRHLFALIATNHQSAVLSLTKEFSPYDQNILVIISATDQGGLQGRCNISINIADVNRPPAFLDNPFSVRIPEDSPLGFHVLQLKANDEDREHNSKLEFSIDSQRFSIDPMNGLITVAEALDREQQSAYIVNVVVSDGGQPPLNASTTLEIVLEDVNDNAPQFLASEYKVSISEDTPVGTSFFQLTAVDADEGPNGIVDYFFDEKDSFVQMDKFRLDRTSGTLRINNPLDREIAADPGSRSTTSSTKTTLIVSLEDVNDNAPQFQQSSYDLWIAENSPIGTIVGTLVAVDADAGPNANIQFKIFGGADAKFFEIEADNKQPGVVNIRSRVEFDFEASTSRFYVELQASSGQLSSTVPITIHVSDVNDNRPQLKDFIVLITQFDNEKSNLTVGRVPAFDPDQNATLDYFIQPNDLLSVDSFGALHLAHTNWRRQINAEHKVCVSDGPNTICAKCLLIYVAVDQEELHNSVTVELNGLSREEFLDEDVFQRFLASISSISDSWLPEDIRVFSVQSASNQQQDSAIGKKMVYKVNVSFFVFKEEQSIGWNSWQVVFLEQQQNLSSLFGFPIRVVEDELCKDEPCPYFQKCRRSLKYIKTKEKIETDNFLMHSMETMRTFSCECPPGFTTVEKLPGECNQHIDMCYNSPCINNGTCIPLENTYRCQCPEDKTGPHCELSLSSASTCLPLLCKVKQQLCDNCKWSPVDADLSCHLRSVSFAGDGYLVVPRAPSRLSWELKLSFATIANHGVLLYSGDLNARSAKTDFLEIFLSRGLPAVEMSLGGDSHLQIGLPEWRENRVNDGEWHTLTLNFFDHKLRLTLDDCDSQVSIQLHNHQPGSNYAECAVEASIKLLSKCLDDPGVPCHRHLDLPSSMLIGARPLPFSSINSNSLVEAGFIGCIRDMMLDSHLIHFSELDMAEKWEITRQRKTQLIALEFEVKSQLLVISLESGQAMVHLNSEQYLIPFPQMMADGMWHSVIAVFSVNFFNLTLDHLYHKHLAMHISNKDVVAISQPQSLYTGQAPSTSHPHQYLGCIRNVELDGTRLRILEQSKTKSGCISHNACALASCPQFSKCQREWDRHSCQCLRGKF
uniref:Uncharacterized protein n=1 Tax=Ditylenchus dipsaci TaxID=166011 RepID=A0A915CQB1_9BILA